MTFNICSSCKFFQHDLKTETVVRPKSCACPALSQWFGEVAGGFP